MVQSLGSRFPRELSSPQKHSPKIFPYCLPEVTAVLHLGFRLFSFFLVVWPHTSLPEAGCLLVVPPWTFIKMLSLGLNFSVPWLFCSRLFLYINVWTCGSFILLRYDISSSVSITSYVSILSVDKSCFCFLSDFSGCFVGLFSYTRLLWTSLHASSHTCSVDSLGCVLQGNCWLVECIFVRLHKAVPNFFSKMTVVVSTSSSDVSEFPLLSSRPTFVRLLNFCQNSRSKMVTLCS